MFALAMLFEILNNITRIHEVIQVIQVTKVIPVPAQDMMLKDATWYIIGFIGVFALGLKLITDADINKQYDIADNLHNQLVRVTAENAELVKISHGHMEKIKMLTAALLEQSEHSHSHIKRHEDTTEGIARERENLFDEFHNNSPPEWA